MATNDDPTLLAQLFSFKPKIAEKVPTTKKDFLNHKTVFLILIVLVLIAYFNSLTGEAVSDDKGLLDEGNLLKLSFIFKDPFNPGRHLIYALLYPVFGFNTLILHLLNLLFHLGNSFLIYLIIAWMGQKRVAYFSAVIFSVHPVLTEAVSWITGGIYAQYAFFFLLSFYFYITGKQKSWNNRNYLLSIGIFLVGLLSYNRVLALSPIFLLYEFLFGDLKKNWRYLLPYFALSLLWVLIYGLQIGGRTTSLAEITYSDTSSNMNPLVQVPFAVTTYLELIFWPMNLSFYHSDLQIGALRLLAKWIGLLVYLGAVVIAYRRNKFLFFWLSFFLINLAITLTPFKIASIVAERYVYLGAVGILVLVGYLVDKVTLNTKSAALLYLLFALGVSMLTIRTIFRNSDWHSTDKLMLATIKTTPQSPRAQNNVGAYYFRNGDLQQAAEHFQAALVANPRFADAYHNLGEVQFRAGDMDKTIALNMEALKYNSKLWQAYKNLGEAYLKKGDKDNALKALSLGLQINPGSQIMLKLQEEAIK